METVIEVDKVNKSFGDEHVLKEFSLSLKKGENLAILGKSGSGKSVLIKCIVKLLSADEGTILVLGENVNELDQENLDDLRAKIGFLFQYSALYDSMTVRQNLEFSMRRHWSKEKRYKEADKIINEVLKDVGLEHTIDMMPADLSGGMSKRIALARALVMRPAIILYDEPTAGLDPITSREISNLIVKIQKKYDASSIIISHDMKSVEIISNRVIMLIDGKNYKDDTFQNLKDSEDPNISEFFK